MLWLSLLTAAIAPGMALLVYFYLKDRYEPEPVHMVARMFLFGALLVFPTMVLQRALVLGFGENPILFSFVYSAGIEEFFKWFVLFFVLYKNEYFNEPYDGIVYSVAVASGFATVENVFYALLNFSSFADLFLRALLPVSGHALFGVSMGYHLGKAKFNKDREKRFLLIAVLLPVFYHGIFDYILLLKTNWVLLIATFMVFLWVRSLRKVRKANDRSSFHPLRSEEEVKMSSFS
ncbi:glutamic-type intramembrane protease PrsW [Paenibacillus sp. J2TS4]|uniref:glutamic-type intramembrane protease PrsW n=1 Tax=Paenibacillus sp. J2TS4 TaxID=2807194 RepID=UPI001B2E5594|nr:glutamic-type intramembrane protease PrsW [Paenibacillus sp. J2TS4]GIP32364.1 protease PrsW [Paenibacillus sp. J2TS4]